MGTQYRAEGARHANETLWRPFPRSFGLEFYQSSVFYALQNAALDGTARFDIDETETDRVRLGSRKRDAAA